MRHAAHHELVRRVAEAVEILEDQAELPHQFRTLELRQRRVELRHEQWIGRRQGLDELGVDGEVIARGVTGAACTSIAVERLLEKEVGASRDDLVHVHAPSG